MDNGKFLTEQQVEEILSILKDKQSFSLDNMVTENFGTSVYYFHDGLQQGYSRAINIINKTIQGKS